MARNLYKKISFKTSKIVLYKIIWGLRKELTSIMIARKRYGKILHTLNQSTATRSTDFINQYHKKRIVWSNKLAYLAGLIDGEGYFKIERWGTIRLVIGMCSKQTIYWVYKNFGGNVTLQKTATKRNFYVWRMNQGRDLFYLLLYLIPFLVTKKKVAINYFNVIVNKIKKLEHTIYPLKFNKEVYHSVH